MRAHKDHIAGAFVGSSGYSEIDRAYLGLAAGIVSRAIVDFLEFNISEYDFDRFLHSEWFAVLSDANPDYLYKKAYNVRLSDDKKTINKFKLELKRFI